MHLCVNLTLNLFSNLFDGEMIITRELLSHLLDSTMHENESLKNIERREVSQQLGKLIISHWAQFST